MSSERRAGSRTGDAAREARTRLLACALSARAPAPGPSFRCPYLPGRTARQLTIVPEPLVPGVYHSLMDLNFRRLGPVFYRPACSDCAECRMIRVVTGEFRPSRSQRRCRARNADLRMRVGSPEPSEEKQRLYKRYLDARHDGQMDGSPEEFAGFLYASGVQTLEVEYRLGARLLAVGIADVEPEAMSAVYCYFDPEAAPRAPGVFNVLWLVDECARRGIERLYLGYYVRDCAKMRYKASYRPCEVLENGRWTRLAQ